ncbi:MAG: dTMP kinase [Candidatus Bathyarchaeota archaeon]|nr:dTMP kinase [Candidatus Bathyarchaeota archaeon]
MSRGFFVCIEGLDKSGKTTQSCILVRDLYQRAFKAYFTTEPSQGEIGRFIRKQILSRRKRVPAVVEALLFAADRYDHSEREIKPMLQNGTIVVSDRYVYSSLAYQGSAGLDLDWIRKINKFSPVPDLAIYIDLPLEVLARRIKSDRSVMERMGTQMMVRNVYVELVKLGELIRVDGNRPAKVVSKEILDLVLSRFGHER